MRELLDKARKGDVATLPALRKILAIPLAVDIWGDLAKHAEQLFVNAMVGDNLAYREGITRKLELLRQELVGPHPTPIERLLAERAVACWLQVYEADMRYAQAKNLEIPWGDYYQRRMDRAHRRYLASLKTLALIRKLAIPALFVESTASLPSLAPSRDSVPRAATATCRHRHRRSRQSAFFRRRESACL